MKTMTTEEIYAAAESMKNLTTTQVIDKVLEMKVCRRDENAIIAAWKLLQYTAQ